MKTSSGVASISIVLSTLPFILSRVSSDAFSSSAACLSAAESTFFGGERFPGEGARPRNVMVFRHPLTLPAVRG